MLTATLSGRFVSHHTERWENDKGGGRRDTISVLDERDGAVYSLQLPRDTPGSADAAARGALLTALREFTFGNAVNCQIEQRSYVPAGAKFATTSYTLWDIRSNSASLNGAKKPVAAAAGAK